MNRKQLLTLLELVAVIGGAGLLVNKRRQGDWQQSSSGGGQKLAGSLDVNAVATVSIDGTVTGLRATTDTAFVQPSVRYDAAKAKVDQLLANNYAHLRTRASERTSASLTAPPTQVTVGHNKVAGTIP